MPVAGWEGERRRTGEGGDVERVDDVEGATGELRGG